MMIEAKRPPAEGGVAQSYLASASVKVAEAESFTIGQSYERAVDLIMAAKGNVTVVGGRFSRHVAGMLASYLAQLRSGVFAQDMLSIESFDSLIDLGRRDVLVMFDYRRYTTNVVEFATEAARSAERRVVQECISPFISPWSP